MSISKPPPGLAHVRVYYELCVSVKDAALDAAIAAIDNQTFDFLQEPFEHQISARTFYVMPVTCEEVFAGLVHLHGHLIKEHLAQTIQVTDDIRSTVIYMNPYTGIPLPIGRDWLSWPAIMTVSPRN